ncbi:hypothetical protein WJ968_05525 [Achromobacter xylosoxidans]
MNAGAIVIVGAGQAGGWAATTLRDRGDDGASCCWATSRTRPTNGRR